MGDIGVVRPSLRWILSLIKFICDVLKVIHGSGDDRKTDLNCVFQ